MSTAGNLGDAAEDVAGSANTLTRAQQARQGARQAFSELFSSHRDAASDAVSAALEKPAELAHTAKGHVVRVAGEATDRTKGAFDILRNGRGAALADVPQTGQGIHLVPSKATSVPGQAEQLQLFAKAQLEETIPPVLKPTLVQKPVPAPAPESPGLWQKTKNFFSRTPVGAEAGAGKAVVTEGTEAAALKAGAAAAGKTVAAEGAAAAAAETAAKVATGGLAARLIGGTALRFTTGSLGAGFAFLPGAVDYGVGRYRHDDRQKNQGKVEMVFAGGGAAVGGLIGLIGGPAGVFAGAAIGGTIGSFAGTLASTMFFKTEDAVDKGLSAVRAKTGAVVNAAEMSASELEYKHLVSNYQKALSVSPTANFQDAQAAVNKAGEADAAVKAQLAKMVQENPNLAPQAAEEAKKADQEYKNFFDRMNAGLAAGSGTVQQTRSGAAPAAGNNAGARTGTGSAGRTGGGYTQEQIDLLKQVQHSIGADEDAKFGHQTRDALVRDGILTQQEAEKVLPLAASKRAYASDAALHDLFNQYGGKIEAYMKAHPNGPGSSPASPARTAPANGQGSAPAGVDSNDTSSAPRQEPAAPVVRPHDIDPRMEAALASLSKEDLRHMHPGAGPGGIGALVGDHKLAAIGMDVGGNGAIETHRHTGPVPEGGAAFDINVMSEQQQRYTGQRYTVTAMDGTDVTNKAPVLSPEAIAQAARDHIATIHVTEVGENSNAFVFTPSKTPENIDRSR